MKRKYIVIFLLTFELDCCDSGDFCFLRGKQNACLRRAELSFEITEYTVVKYFAKNHLLIVNRYDVFAFWRQLILAIFKSVQNYIFKTHSGTYSCKLSKYT